MKKPVMELTMALLLLVSFFLLSREAAEVVNEKRSQTLILVDAGHGGEDPGMIGTGGLKEKEMNLIIAKQLKEELEKRNYTVLMTRTEDEGLYESQSRNKKVEDLQNRISMIQKNSPALSVSIHQNSYPDASVYGPQVFYYKDSAEGRKLGVLLQESLNETLEISHKREAKGNGSYYLLKRSPGILVIVECGFLTNPEEAKLLQTKAYQEKVAQAIADGIGNYMS